MLLHPLLVRAVFVLLSFSGYFSTEMSEKGQKLTLTAALLYALSPGDWSMMKYVLTMLLAGLFTLPHIIFPNYNTMTTFAAHR